MNIEKTFAVSSLETLRQLLSTTPEKHRDSLLKEFWKVCQYRSANEWNRAVRLCEALAIVGWGDAEPLEAYCGGDWTAFQNRIGERRFVSAEWSKRKAGITIAPDRATYYASPDQPGPTGDFPVEVCVQDVKLTSQRNWIPKNPIHLYQWLDNSDNTTRKLVDSINEQLIPALERKMKPEAYGATIDRLWIDFCFSTRLRGNREILIVIDEDIRMSPAQLHKRLLTMYPATKIKRDNLFLRPRTEYGNFLAEKGTLKVTLNFPMEFNKLSFQGQKQEFAARLRTAVAGAAERVKPRAGDYDFNKLLKDLQKVLKLWEKKA